MKNEKSIFDEVNLVNLKAKNRLVRSATWENLAAKDGEITPELYEMTRQLADGGVGTIITGFTSVSQNDIHFGGMMRLGSDQIVPSYKKLTKIAHAKNVRILAQLALGGYYEKASENFITFEPDELSKEQIENIVSLFVAAAIRAQEAKFDGVQIHAAHFFFLSRFISPTTNHRNDEYGGSTQNRARILCRIIKGIRQKMPNFHISMKLNMSDMTPGGLEFNESSQIAKFAADAGLNSIEVSANGTSQTGVKAGINEAYFYPYAKALAKSLDIPVMLVGGHRSVQNMNRLLNDSKIELLSLSRPLIRESDLINRWQNGDLAPAKCISCNGCYRTAGHQCVFNLK